MALASFAPRSYASPPVPAALRLDVSVCRVGIDEPGIASRIRSFSFDALNCKFVHGASMTGTHDPAIFFLDGPAGRLEAILMDPTATAHPPLAAVVCHPHPLFGVRCTTKWSTRRRNLSMLSASPCCRFNFRALDSAPAIHDRGLGEPGDVRAALDFLLRVSWCPPAYSQIQFRLGRHARPAKTRAALT